MIFCKACGNTNPGLVGRRLRVTPLIACVVTSFIFISHTSLAAQNDLESSDVIHHHVTGNSQVPEQGPKKLAVGNQMMVSALHPDSTEVILQVLRDGGNAVDAAIAGIIAECVLLPHLVTLAGGVGGLIYSAGTGELLYLDGELDFTSRSAPIGRSVPITSGLRIGTPGLIRGLAAAAERFGTLSWEEYVAPAVKIAEEGFPMYSFLYGEMWPAIDRLSMHPSGREQWTPTGVVPLVGETFRFPRLAETLRRLGVEGPNYFYKGEGVNGRAIMDPCGLRKFPPSLMLRTLRPRAL